MNPGDLNHFYAKDTQQIYLRRRTITNCRGHTLRQMANRKILQNVGDKKRGNFF